MELLDKNYIKKIKRQLELTNTAYNEGIYHDYDLELVQSELLAFVRLSKSFGYITKEQFEKVVVLVIDSIIDIKKNN